MKKIDVVGAVILNEKNEILCALRSQKMSLPGLWEFPGGKIEANETPQESLIREIQEELNCTIRVGELVSDAAYEYPTIIVRLITYLAKIVDGAPIANEHERLIWLPIDQLFTLEWAPADLPTIEALTTLNINAQNLKI
ncbi:(deoxy)nucleoside triphosphate pyrophosphohydrolase [Paenibacillus psychroresistens]|uniref:8-oxo-dGTP diphosphatase n=1 Tax=Paenibacillus psychroresistens TaxID=1778678 RepID=A0A6B8REC6_9BACL|nr:(deoxy)nucleoside triphosphate pyrophosphohydrolase [Paenibacillus psychroresistens]QGQ93818.1 (deoxy)nucleoside triphosphate pyrophosphohydrolase [Paenibacillus psychroresistens]